VVIVCKYGFQSASNSTALADDQIHLQIAHPLLRFDDCRTSLDVHPADDLAPFALRTAPFGVPLALGAHVAVQLSALLLVLPDELVDALVRDALDALAGGFADDLLGAVIVFNLLPNAGLNAGRQAPSLGLGLVAGLGLVSGDASLGQIGPARPVALVAVMLQLAADRGFTTAEQLGNLALGVIRFHKGGNVIPLFLCQELHDLLMFGNPKV